MDEPPDTPPGRDADRESLMHLMGGRRGAAEGAAPSITFVVAYAVVGATLGASLLVALGVAALVAGIRVWRHESLRHVLGGLAAVAIAAGVAARTGQPEDYFLPSLLANLAAALIWASSIVVGWPLLGVIVGAAVGQRTSWRADPHLMLAYSRASWIWAVSFVVRAGVMTPLYLSGQVLALGVAKVVLGWPMVLVVIWLSWIAIRRTLPDGHLGILGRRPTHPVEQ
jgi:hypothetical protein